MSPEDLNQRLRDECYGPLEVPYFKNKDSSMGKSVFNITTENLVVCQDSAPEESMKVVEMVNLGTEIFAKTCNFLVRGKGKGKLDVRVAGGDVEVVIVNV